MDIGIGLPAAIPGVSGPSIIEWAIQAETGPFSSVSLIDRLVYPNHEPLITLAAVAGATQRVRLVTTVLLAPLRNPGVLAKQAATLDSISNGRLTLGLGVGGREDDYLASPAQFKNRGRRLDQQLETMKRIWAGEPAGNGAGAVGPPPVREGGPELLIGANSPRAMARVGRWADGFMSGGGGAEGAKQSYEAARRSWQDAGRSGQPRLVAGAYFALDEDAKSRGTDNIMHYYGEPLGPMISGSMPDTPDAVRSMISAYHDAGCDELILWPTIPDFDQVSRLGEII
ncbi:MAG: LLM class flavin-dependent oxidoreductase [SAR202 cluster bacterium]|jgi:alkanesulfonate monooxygenase SsuD/methylene tetrahydromethanopterin reductase-like flavin-dependent oxidoreductase (luciferase family)|nr:LLM class flavin-dependent oxidoreductase [SAR202 cluster bacterium]